ncbi:MAG: MinD/ParA family protein [Chloroflexales bacterium]|nr:MinD/ParA family protein [Chloroflexales bacterium]
MAKIISIHSFRGGTGKSNTTANVTALLAARGLRVGVVDTDIQSPGIHVLFNVNEDQMSHSLNDYLWGKCEIKDAAQDVTPTLRQLNPKIGGQVFLIASSIKAGEIARILREGYDVGLLNDGFQRLLLDLDLDVLMIDTHPGLNEETLLSIAISDALAIILRPDNQDYQGTGVTVEIARKLDVPNLVLVVNKVPQIFDFAAVQQRVEQTYDCEVGAILPHSDEMMALASAGIFVLRYPNHPITSNLERLAARLMA